MTSDPIVKEVRDAGARLAAEAGYDVHTFFENLRRTQKEFENLLVREPLSNYRSSRTDKSSDGI